MRKKRERRKRVEIREWQKKGEKRKLGNQEMTERTTVNGISQKFISGPATHSRTKKTTVLL
jgi:hypothetical protein